MLEMSWLRKWCIIITEKKGFEYFIIASILANTIILGSFYFMMEESEKKII